MNLLNCPLVQYSNNNRTQKLVQTKSDTECFSRKLLLLLIIKHGSCSAITIQGTVEGVLVRQFWNYMQCQALCSAVEDMALMVTHPDTHQQPLPLSSLSCCWLVVGGRNHQNRHVSLRKFVCVRVSARSHFDIPLNILRFPFKWQWWITVVVNCFLLIL